MDNYIPHKDVTIEQLKNNDFYYSDGLYAYRFPVYNYAKNKRNTLLWGTLYIDIDNRTCSIAVTDSNNRLYATFHNRTYSGSNNKVITDIESKIRTNMNKLIKLNIIKKKK